MLHQSVFIKNKNNLHAGVIINNDTPSENWGRPAQSLVKNIHVTYML